MRIAILGCGPSGLVAAHAAMALTVPKIVHVYSKPERSPIWGAQYLHQPIPRTFTGHDIEPEIIRYVMRGAPEAYLRKVYGDEWDGTVNDDLRDQAHVAWSLRSTYDELWMKYSELIRPYEIPRDVAGIRASIGPMLDNYDLVINTIPRPKLCLLGHNFVSTSIWAMGESDDRPFPIDCAENVIEYNGDSTPSWYRTSRIHGYSTVEWPGHLPKPPIPGVTKVLKPLKHNCDCWIGSIVHLGRMGRWQNGRLVHHVYADMYEQLMLLGVKKGIGA